MHNILDAATLWGSDGVDYGQDKKHYVDQPGYRYYPAGMIRLSGGENRIMQSLNPFVLLQI